MAHHFTSKWMCPRPQANLCARNTKAAWPMTLSNWLLILWVSIAVFSSHSEQTTTVFSFCSFPPRYCFQHWPFSPHLDCCIDDPLLWRSSLFNCSCGQILSERGAMFLSSCQQKEKGRVEARHRRYAGRESKLDTVSSSLSCVSRFLWLTFSLHWKRALHPASLDLCALSSTRAWHVNCHGPSSQIFLRL